MGKLTISMAIFHSYVSHYPRVSGISQREKHDEARIFVVSNRGVSAMAILCWDNMG